MLPIDAGDLSALLGALAAAHGDRLAVAGEHGALSFAGLEAAADAWADALAAAGCGPGTHVGLLAGNGPQWLGAAFGVWRAGATLVPLSTFVTVRELDETLALGDVEVLVVQPELRGRDLLALVRAAPAAVSLRHLLVLGTSAPAGPGETLRPAIDAESAACLLYTSGTTGKPKGVLLSHRAILATVWPTAERSGLGADDALFSTLPLFWVAGLVIRALPTLASGCALLLVETFTADAAIAALRRQRVTALHVRPPQVGQITAHRDFDPALLAAVRKGNGRVEWFAPFLDAEQTRFITGYGMTETAGYVTALDWRDSVDVRRTELGTPLPGVEVRAIGPDGVRCGPGEVGEIRVRGPGLFSGYYKQPPGTGLDGDGFFRTGDLGRVRSEGGVQFIGRSKDLLRVKGINVSPLEVEAVLGSHPAVEAVYVVGLPPDGLDQRLVAVVVPRPGGALPEAALRELATESLSAYKRPEAYVTVARQDVPLGSTAKPQRAALAALAERALAPVG